MTNIADYKISIFCRFDDTKLYNDYLDTSTCIDDKQLLLLKTVLNNKDTVDLRLLIKEDFEWLIDNNVLILKELNELEMFYPHYVDIETSTGCNFSCKFCPQSIAPKKNTIMPMKEFKLIIDKLDSYNVKYITFQHYNEPLLDPYFFKRLDYIKFKNIKLYLYTNAMNLSKEITDKLNKYDLHGININFPSIDQEEWSNLTNQPKKNHNYVINNITYFANNYGRRLTEFLISVNGKSDYIYTKIDKLKQFLSESDLKRTPKIFNAWSHSRAGNIENEYVTINEKRTEECFTGCLSINSHLNISYKGEVFLCCQDYHQDVILGNLLTESVKDIISKEKTQHIRGMLYGVYPMADDLICRKCEWLR